MIVVLVDSVQ